MHHRSLAYLFGSILACSALACGDDAASETGDGYYGEAGDGGEGLEGGGDSGGAGEGSNGDGDGDIEPGQLTAGEWRDLDHWDFWLALGEDGSTWLTEFDHWGFDTRSRVPVFAVSDGEPAIDAPVVIRDASEQVLWQARTDNLGRAELWPTLLTGGEPSWPLTIASGQVSVEIDALPDVLEPVLLELPAAAPPLDLDLMFVIDTTGSMGDELSYIQAELGDVITRVSTQLANDFELRLSVNFYRDVGDEYVVRSFPFTADVDAALTDLAAQSADGGGDLPEAVEQALDDAIHAHQWSSSARARLLFLVLDAPPHDTSTVRENLKASVTAAAEQGIRVIPVVASGMDKSGEFLLREIDIATGGTYTFLTDHSGIGGEHLEPTIGEYEVELFNDLLVRLIVAAMQ